MLFREGVKTQIETALRRSRVTALLGPRQSGKTTLAREFVPSDSINYFDLEEPESLARLDQPKLALENLTGLVVIDGIQRKVRRTSCYLPRPESVSAWRIHPSDSLGIARLV